MGAYWAFFGCFACFHDETAVSAFPFDGLVFLVDFALVDAVEEF